jgi:hypothetical protein
LAALGLMLVVTLPNSLLEPYVCPLLLQLRVAALLAALWWLLVMSTKRTAPDIGIARGQHMTPCRP